MQTSSDEGKSGLSEDFAVRLRGVSKKYQLYESLKHRVYEALHPYKRKYHREFWALQDIDLDIPKGMTIGILGVNGSGKSTLLQVICGVLQPTHGSVAVRGKVAALIELGAGFNPELTGRENAEINCAIMGLDARAVRDRMPEIEAFADIREFFDQPVKTYSSGMLMRTAFATAITVDPDILVIDEALAVGDARFQQKCFRKFRDFQSAGKTILLVTHDRSAVPRLCSLGLLLHGGKLLYCGLPKEATDRYSHLLTHGDDAAIQGMRNALHGAESFQAAPLPIGNAAPAAVAQFMSEDSGRDRCPLNPTYNKNEFSYGLGGAAIVDYMVLAGDLVNPTDVESGAIVDIFMRVRFERPIDLPLVGVSVKARDGTLVYGIHSGWLGQHLSAGLPGAARTYRLTVNVDLAADDWFFDLAVAASQSEILHTREGVLNLRVTSKTMTTGLAALRTSITEMP